MNDSITPVPIGSWSATRIFFPAGDYRHPPSGLVQLRLVRRGSSYADIDLGAGRRRVFTRPGDLLLSLPDRPTAFRIDDGRQLTVLQVGREHASRMLEAAGGRLEELAVLLERPMRDALVAELCRRLETTAETDAVYREWSLGVVLGSLLRRARSRRNSEQPGVLSHRRLRAVLETIDQRLDEPLPVEDLAKSVGLSTRAFGSAFRQAMALPVHQYVLRRRADRAFDLVMTTDRSLADTARMSGFSHQAHMTRVVGRLKGSTPGKLRLRSAGREGR